VLTGVLAGLAAGALWGLVFVAPRMTPGLSSVDLAAGRFISYGIVAALVMLLTWRSHKLPTASQALAALGMSLLGFTGYYLLLVLAIQRAGTEVPTLIIGTIPIWAMLLGKPHGLKWSSLFPGLLLTATGLVLMMHAMSASQPVATGASSEGGAGFWWGVLLAVAATVCWTAYAILNTAWLKRHPQVNAAEWANWLGIATGVGAVLLWLVAGSPSKELSALDSIAWSAIICIATGVGSAWLATILWNIASQRLSASLCGQMIVSETLFALFYSYVWDGHWPTVVPLVACVCFVLGILASIRAHR
jgi:drug/metabolite transporter (DMT)-like permease